jgi:hypothetical protein
LARPVRRADAGLRGHPRRGVAKAGPADGGAGRRATGPGHYRFLLVKGAQRRRKPSCFGDNSPTLTYQVASLRSQ